MIDKKFMLTKKKFLFIARKLIVTLSILIDIQIYLIAELNILNFFFIFAVGTN